MRFWLQTFQASKLTLSQPLFNHSATLQSLSSSPRILIWLTTLRSWSINSLTNSNSFFLKDSYSILKFNTYICLVLTLPWNSSFSLSQASLGIVQAIILVNITSNTPACNAKRALNFLATSSLCCFGNFKVRIAYGSFALVVGKRSIILFDSTTLKFILHVC